MKKLIIFAIASLLSSNTHALEASTDALAYTLAQTIYTAAVGMASTEAISISTTHGSQKAEALRIQNEAQNYYQNGVASIYLESKIQIAQELNNSLSEEESVDLLLQASSIILAK